MNFYIAPIVLALGTWFYYCYFDLEGPTDIELWVKFKKSYRQPDKEGAMRGYSSPKEEEMRFSIFQSNLRMIEKHNELYAMGKKSYRKGINKFADMTTEEFKSMLMHDQKIPTLYGQQPIVWHTNSNVKVEESVNWVTKGVVTDVQNQGYCKCCWAFSAIGAVEGAYAIKTGNLVKFSEQNLVDCSFENDGCYGGMAQRAFNYIRHSGIAKESNYPYTAIMGICKFNSSLSATRVSGYAKVNQDESSLQDAVATVGPVSVAINGFYLQSYIDGVLDESSCDGSRLDHEVLVVGYGSQDGLDYWLVKNSWGSGWGEAGYVKMARNRENQCGIANDASYPIL